MNSHETQCIDVVISSRRDALYLGPIVHELRNSTNFRVRTIVVKTPNDEVIETLESIHLQPDLQFGVRGAEQNSGAYLGEIHILFSELWSSTPADWILTFGHENAALSASLAAFQNKIRCAHVEDVSISDAFPGSRSQRQKSQRVISMLSTLHFTSLPAARNRLIYEGNPEDSIYLVGNILEESSARLFNTISSTDFIRNNFCSFTGELVQKIVSGEFIFVEFNSAKYSDFLTHFTQSAPSHFSERLAFFHSLRTGHAHAVAPTFDSTPSHKPIPLRHLQRCALLAKAGCVITDSDQTLEECASFGTKAILLHSQTHHEDLINAQLATIAVLEIDSFQNQVVNCLSENATRRAQRIAGLQAKQKQPESRKIVRAITSQTGGSVQTPKTRLPSQRAG